MRLLLNRFYRHGSLLLLVTLLVSGCAGSPRIIVDSPFRLAPSQEIMPVLPFTSTLVPEEFSESVFNNFVDILNDNHSKTNIKWFSIIKEDLSEASRVIPPDHLYVTGEVWSYIENSGCCSTELRVKARVRFYRAGSPERLMEIQLPMEGFFDHDRSTLSVERDKLALRLAQEMAKQVLQVLKNASPAAPAP